MNSITFGELLEQYIEITGDNNAEKLGKLVDWVIRYEKKDGVYHVLMDPPDAGK